MTSEKGRSAPLPELRHVPPDSERAREAARQYYGELRIRLTGRHEDKPATDDLALGPPHGTFLVATAGEEAVACGGLRRFSPDIGEIKRLWVDPRWRGHGLGRRVLRELESTARQLGYTEIRLDTAKLLTEAIGMYERAGYTQIERYNDNPYAELWFRKKLGNT